MERPVVIERREAFVEPYPDPYDRRPHDWRPYYAHRWHPHPFYGRPDGYGPYAEGRRWDGY